VQVNKRASREPGRGVFLALFLLSGFTGVVFEVVASKLLGLVMGNSVYSITTVVTSFMAGLALGSALSERIARGRRPLVVYGALEVGVAVCCLALPFALDAVQPLLKLAYAHFADSFYVMSAIRFALAFTILLVPTTLMGATLPVLATGLARDRESIATTVGLLYAINSLGAVAGALGASFVLLPSFGIALTLKLTALIDLAIGYVAYRADWWRGDEVAAEPRAPADAVAIDGEPEPSHSLPALASALALAGFAAMVYEIAWTRALILVIGTSTYAFAMILASFIFGISLGAFIATRLERFGTPTGTLMAGFSAALSVVGLATLPLICQLPMWLMDLLTDFSNHWWLLQLVELTMVGAVVAVPATLMGTCFPLAAKLAVSREGLTRSLGRLYAANTAGNIAGSFTSGAILIPRMGIESTIAAASMIEGLVAAIFCLALVPADKRTRLQLAAGALLLPVVVYSALPGWDQLMMNSGVYLYAGLYHRTARSNQTDIRNAVRLSGRTVYYKEGISATVSVRELTSGDRGLVVNGKTDASSVSDMKTQRFVGHLPMLMHKDPKKALVIGLGSGVTLASLLAHPVEKADLIEISPEIVEASKFFARENRDALSDPRVKLTVTDARNHLMLTDERYDVIVSEPTNPWIAGVASLFTQEFFQSLRAHLNPGGVCGAWVQAYSTTTHDFKAVIATFRSVFPHVTFWRSTKGTDYLMIGTETAVYPDRKLLEQKYKVSLVKTDLAEIGIEDTSDLLAHFIATPAKLDPFVAGGLILTDDNLALEFSAPRNLYLKDQPALGLPESLLEDVTPHLSIVCMREREELARVVSARREIANALGYLRGGDFEAAVDALKTAKKLAPKERGSMKIVQALYLGLSSLLEKAGRSDEALVWLKRILDLHPDDPELFNELGNLCGTNGKTGDAETYYKKALSLDPRHVAALKNLGVVYYQTGRFEEGIKAYEQVVRLSPYEAKMHNNLGILYEKIGRFEDARRTWNAALKVDPGYDAPRRNIEMMEQAMSAKVEPKMLIRGVEKPGAPRVELIKGGRI
jgi:spermidine synthase